MADWLARLDGRWATVEVPATTANLGAGFDCLGMALELTNRITVEVAINDEAPDVIVVDGEGAGELEAGSGDRFVRGLEMALREVIGELPSTLRWRISMVNRIPLARGLGSSAAATVGGLVAANALLGGLLTTADLLRLATEIEGHPDNAAPALLGGFAVSAELGDSVNAIRFDVPRGLRAVVFVPDVWLTTEEMRRV
jgi:homoserine kinase